MPCIRHPHSAPRALGRNNKNVWPPGKLAEPARATEKASPLCPTRRSPDQPGYDLGAATVNIIR